MQTVWATVREGKIELLDPVSLPEGGALLVTILSSDDEQRFWLAASQSALDEVWGNDEDDVYAKLLDA